MCKCNCNRVGREGDEITLPNGVKTKLLGCARCGGDGRAMVGGDYDYVQGWEMGTCPECKGTGLFMGDGLNDIVRANLKREKCKANGTHEPNMHGFCFNCLTEE